MRDTLKMKKYTTEELMSVFIGVLYATNVTEDTIHGICSMMWNNKPMMDELVAYIEQNPSATEAQITEKACQIIGKSSRTEDKQN